MKFPAWFAAFFVSGAAIAAQDARAIVERSIRAGNNNDQVAQKYVYQARESMREIDANGNSKNNQSSVKEILYIGGKRYERLIEKNGKPLDAGEARKEQEKIDRAVRDATRLTPEQRTKRDVDAERENAKERERLQYVPRAYDFRLIGETQLNGRAVWEIEATPKGDYNDKYRSLLRNTRGKLFIDQKDYQWVRVEAEVLDTISFGLFLARLGKGTRVKFEQTRLNDEVWLPRKFSVQASARLALVKVFRINAETEYGNYRKFQSDSKVVGYGDAEPPGKP